MLQLIKTQHHNFSSLWFRICFLSFLFHVISACVFISLYRILKHKDCVGTEIKKERKYNLFYIWYDTVQCNSEHPLNFELKLDYQFNIKYTLSSVLITCINFVFRPSEQFQRKNRINCINIKTSDSEQTITPWWLAFIIRMKYSNLCQKIFLKESLCFKRGLT